MALPDTLLLVAGTPIVYGEASASILGLTVTKTLSLDALANGSGRMSVYQDLYDGNSRLPEWLLVQFTVETGTAPTAGTVAEAYCVFSNSTSLWPGEVTGADAAYPTTVADKKKQLGAPAVILVSASASSNVVQIQQGAWIRVKGRYLTSVVVNLLGQAFRDETTASNNTSGVVVTPYYSTICE